MMDLINVVLPTCLGPISNMALPRPIFFLIISDKVLEYITCKFYIQYNNL